MRHPNHCSGPKDWRKDLERRSKNAKHDVCFDERETLTKELSTPVYCPRPFHQNEQYEHHRRNLQNCVTRAAVSWEHVVKKVPWPKFLGTRKTQGPVCHC
ncbi:hypothetical protein FQN60_016731, partial [Etheostoma spectabile]